MIQLVPREGEGEGEGTRNQLGLEYENKPAETLRGLGDFEWGRGQLRAKRSPELLPPSNRDPKVPSNRTIHRQDEQAFGSNDPAGDDRQGRGLQLKRHLRRAYPSHL